MTSVSDLIQSAATVAASSISIKIGPSDKRCRYWAKVLRAGSALPLPSAVEGATDVPGAYARNGDEELFAGDIVIDGEANHHVKARGWTYNVGYMTASGEKRWLQPSSEIKAALKAAGLPAHLLPGSGEVAACVRIAHAIRLGIEV